MVRSLSHHIYFDPLLKALTAEDIDDLCALAEHYSNITPNSFRAQYFNDLFSGNSKSQKPPGLHLHFYFFPRIYTHICMLMYICVRACMYLNILYVYLYIHIYDIAI